MVVGNHIQVQYLAKHICYMFLLLYERAFQRVHVFNTFKQNNASDIHFSVYLN